MENKIIIAAIVIAVVVICVAVAFAYRKELEKLIKEPKDALKQMVEEWEEFISKDSTKQALKALCRRADRIVGGTGEDRLAFVCGKLYQLVPVSLQFIITTEKLEEIVTLVYEEIKIKLEDGSYVAGE